MKTRRGFLGALTALMAAPWAPKPVKMAPVTMEETLALLEVPDDVWEMCVQPEMFVGSFKLGVKTREAALSREARARVKACTRELEKWCEAIDPPLHRSTGNTTVKQE